MNQDSTLRATSPQRPVRSYVLRQGRISAAQQRAYQELAQAFCIAYAPRELDLTQVFGRQAPKIVEIGFGMGDTTAAIAAAQPQCDFLGVEVHTPGVGALLKLLQAQLLHNVRVIQHDAVEVLREMIAPHTLDGAHIFFPDPWPKKRHHKRRLIQTDFVALLASRLKPGGYLHLATDWQDYAVQMLEVLGAEPSLRNRAQAFCARPAHRPLTKFERRAHREGRDTWDLLFERA